MQLFTIGTVELNQDGTVKMDSEGNTVPTYTNGDIISFSRAWTGFRRQIHRGNIEGKRRNRIDPMRIKAEWRDRFPKSNLYEGYIGDSYPLCVDLPSKMFLKKGAKYRLLGGSSLPELMEDPIEFETGEQVKHFNLDTDSALKKLLCNEDLNSTCHYQNSVTLQFPIICGGSECHIDTIRVVKVAESIFYEYVQPPCVQQMFYDNAKKLSNLRGKLALCGNPILPVAAEACCTKEYDAERSNVYDGERTTFSRANSRCSLIERETCNFTRVNGLKSSSAPYFWTNHECELQVKVNAIGFASMVHKPERYTEKVSHINDENKNWFKVYWDDKKYPNITTSCDGLCDVLSEGSCLCNVAVVKSVVFDIMPESIFKALSKLYIGAIDPSIYDDNAYTNMTDPTTGITAHSKNGIMSTETIFEFTDDKGRKRLFKNAQENVQLIDASGNPTQFSFRNVPHFMSLVPNEETVR